MSSRMHWVSNTRHGDNAGRRVARVERVVSDAIARPCAPTAVALVRVNCRIGRVNFRTDNGGGGASSSSHPPKGVMPAPRPTARWASSCTRAKGEFHWAGPNHATWPRFLTGGPDQRSAGIATPISARAATAQICVESAMHRGRLRTCARTASAAP